MAKGEVESESLTDSVKVKDERLHLNCSHVNSCVHSTHSPSLGEADQWWMKERQAKMGEAVDGERKWVRKLKETNKIAFQSNKRSSES